MNGASSMMLRAQFSSLRNHDVLPPSRRDRSRRRRRSCLAVEGLETRALLSIMPMIDSGAETSAENNYTSSLAADQSASDSAVATNQTDEATADTAAQQTLSNVEASAADAENARRRCRRASVWHDRDECHRHGERRRSERHGRPQRDGSERWQHGECRRSECGGRPHRGAERSRRHVQRSGSSGLQCSERRRNLGGEPVQRRSHSGLEHV